MANYKRVVREFDRGTKKGPISFGGEYLHKVPNKPPPAPAKKAETNKESTTDSK